MAPIQGNVLIPFSLHKSFTCIKLNIFFNIFKAFVAIKYDLNEETIINDADSTLNFININRSLLLTLQFYLLIQNQVTHYKKWQSE